MSLCHFPSAERHAGRISLHGFYSVLAAVSACCIDAAWKDTDFFFTVVRGFATGCRQLAVGGQIIDIAVEVLPVNFLFGTRVAN